VIEHHLRVPECLAIGVDLMLCYDLPRWPASQGWLLSLICQGPASLTLGDTPSGDKHQIIIPAASTSGWTAGHYWWTARIVNVGLVQTHQIGYGELDIEANASTITAPYDGRTLAKRTLDAIDAVISGRATLDQQSYKIGTRELVRIPVTELMTFRNTYAWRVYYEQRREKGKNSIQDIKFRF